MNFEAKIIADSMSPDGKRITTMQLRYPRFIHSEFLTHRVFSRNASSSRAIPVAKMIEQVRSDPAMPIHWGKNQPGMQANEQLDDIKKPYAQHLWMVAAHQAAETAELMSELGLHKQVANRILEPFQFMHTIVTSTEWDNFFALRCHEDAQPEIQTLALRMQEAMEESTPAEINYGEWHLPYVKTYRGLGGVLYYGEDAKMSLEDARKVSASCCAQVSYRALDDSLEKALDIFKRLVESRPMHASPFEHQATPLPPGFDRRVCHNFTGWVQHRAILEDELQG